jgi:hypothetical protein
MTRDDKDDYYDLVCNVSLELYCEQSGDPISPQVEEMDRCVRGWEPTRFVQLWNELMCNSNWKAKIQS